jgi:hypothetical protein
MNHYIINDKRPEASYSPPPSLCSDDFGEQGQQVALSFALM